MNGQNVFAGAFVDRWGHRREDPDWLKRAIESDDSCFVPAWGDKCLVSGEPFHTILLDRHDVGDHMLEQEVVFLGKFRDKPAFAFGRYRKPGSSLLASTERRIRSPRMSCF